jgi:hypothetical protein
MTQGGSIVFNVDASSEIVRPTIFTLLTPPHHPTPKLFTIGDTSQGISSTWSDLANLDSTVAQLTTTITNFESAVSSTVASTISSLSAQMVQMQTNIESSTTSATTTAS